MVSQLFPSLGKKDKVALQYLCLVDVTGNLPTSAVCRGAQSLDTALSLACTVVKSSDKLLQRGTIAPEHAKRLLQSEGMKKRHHKKNGQQDFQPTLDAAHSALSSRTDAT